MILLLLENNILNIYLALRMSLKRDILSLIIKKKRTEPWQLEGGNHRDIGVG